MGYVDRWQGEVVGGWIEGPPTYLVRWISGPFSLLDCKHGCTHCYGYWQITFGEEPFQNSNIDFFHLAQGLCLSHFVFGPEQRVRVRRFFFLFPLSIGWYSQFPQVSPRDARSRDASVKDDGDKKTVEGRGGREKERKILVRLRQRSRKSGNFLGATVRPKIQILMALLH